MRRSWTAAEQLAHKYQRWMHCRAGKYVSSPARDTRFVCYGALVGRGGLIHKMMSCPPITAFLDSRLLQAYSWGHGIRVPAFSVEILRCSMQVCNPNLSPYLIRLAFCFAISIRNILRLHGVTFSPLILGMQGS